MKKSYLIRALYASAWVGSAVISLYSIPYASATASESMPLQLAETLNLAEDEIDLTDYYFTEKYDGVRGYWNGKKLLTRQGNVIHAPEWFTDQLPWFPVEGELWMGRGTFDQVSGLVRQLEPDEDEWKKVRFMLFDLPGYTGCFMDRRSVLTHWLEKHPSTSITSVPLTKYKDNIHLLAQLDQWQAEGAEGIMLYNSHGFYHSKRTHDLLKLKGYQDAEAVVIGYVAGKGKYEGQVGSLIVENGEGVQFKVGSGLNDADRQSPPELGTSITYRYNGYTTGGKPRFARYARIYNP